MRHILRCSRLYVNVDGMTEPLTPTPDRPPLERREPGRAAKIAAIHALADWFELHPDVPMPNGISCYAWMNSDDEADEGLRFEAGRAAMRAAGMPEADHAGDEKGLTGCVAIATRADGGIGIRYWMQVLSDAWHRANRV